MHFTLNDFTTAAAILIDRTAANAGHGVAVCALVSVVYRASADRCDAYATRRDLSASVQDRRDYAARMVAEYSDAAEAWRDAAIKCAGDSLHARNAARRALRDAAARIDTESGVMDFCGFNMGLLF